MTVACSTLVLLLLASGTPTSPYYLSALGEDTVSTPGMRHVPAASEGPHHQHQPNVLIVYTSSSKHTKSLATAISDALQTAGAVPDNVRMKDISDCDVRMEVLGWADVVLVGGPVERGDMAQPMEKFVTNMERLAEAHPFMKGKVMAAFSTGGAISAGAEAIVARANGVFLASGYSVPSFNDSWDFSTGLVAITGEVPFCQVGQTDRFPHGSGSDAVLKGCEVGADKPPGSLHPRFLQLADEYGRRLRGYILQHMKERRRQVPVEKDRLTLHAAEMTTDIDWGNFGEDGELDGNWPSSGDGRRGSSNYSGQALAGFTESTGKQLAVVVTGAIVVSVAWSRLRRRQSGTNGNGSYLRAAGGLQCGCDAASAAPATMVLNVDPSSNTLLQSQQ